MTARRICLSSDSPSVLFLLLPSANETAKHLLSPLLSLRIILSHTMFFFFFHFKVQYLDLFRPGTIKARQKVAIIFLFSFSLYS